MLARVDQDTSKMQESLSGEKGRESQQGGGQDITADKGRTPDNKNPFSAPGTEKVDQRRTFH